MKTLVVSAVAAVLGLGYVIGTSLVASLSAVLP